MAYRSAKWNKLTAYAANAKLLLFLAFNLSCHFLRWLATAARLLYFYTPVETNYAPLIVSDSLHSALSVFLGDILSLVVFFLTYGYGKLHLHLSVFQVEAERYEGISLLCYKSCKFPDFLLLRRSFLFLIGSVL